MKLRKFLVTGLTLGALVACVGLVNAQDNDKKEGGPGGPGGGGGRQRGGAMSVDARMERMSKELNLTDEQKPKVKAVLQEQMDKIKNLSPEERREKMRSSREEMDKKMKDILTAEQYKKWENFRPGRPGGGGPGGAGGPDHKPGDKPDKKE